MERIQYNCYKYLKKAAIPNDPVFEIEINVDALLAWTAPQTLMSETSYTMEAHEEQCNLQDEANLIYKN